MKGSWLFEPHPISASWCKMNFLLNDYEESNLYQMALGNSEGKTRITDFGSSSTINKITKSGGLTVNINRLDNVIGITKVFY